MSFRLFFHHAAGPEHIQLRQRYVGAKLASVAAVPREVKSSEWCSSYFMAVVQSFRSVSAERAGTLLAFGRAPMWFLGLPGPMVLEIRNPLISRPPHTVHVASLQICCLMVPRPPLDQELVVLLLMSQVPLWLQL